MAKHDIPLVQFEKRQRKDAVMAEHLRRFAHQEGVVFVGKAQENTPVFRTERRRSPRTGQPYPWIVRRSAMVNNYYIYAVDRDFGPFFLKFLQLLSIQCQALPKRPRMRQASACRKTSRLRRSTTAF